MPTPLPTVRVRFAPSPTGMPHIGNLRTAVVNWLFARHSGGVLVIRSEDTDAERSERRFETAHEEALRWLGVEWDEGPDIGGPYGPYRQSERQSFYDASLARLFQANKAYHCFCSETQLHADRRRANSHGVPYVYSRKCRRLDPAESAARIAAGEPGVVRFDIHGHDLTIHDLVKGDIRFSGELLGDFVIVRADGKPTYNFVAAVDDIGMEITHVLRGDDHLTNTPRQIAIQEVLGHTSPKYGHLPLLLGDSGSKMSKREGTFSVDRFQRKGILPAAVVNYLSLLGWSPPDVADGEVFMRDDLIAIYDLGRISHSPAHYEASKLEWFNAQHLRRTPPAELLVAFRQYWVHRYPERKIPASLSDPRPGSEMILEALQDSFSSMREAIRDYRGVARRPSKKQLAKLLSLSPAPEVLLVCKRALESVPDLGLLSEEEVAMGLKSLQKQLQKSEDLKPRQFYHALRIVLTGYEEGPELKKVIHLLDPIELRARLDINVADLQATANS